MGPRRPPSRRNGKRFDLKGRTALVTGSTSGIGEAAAEALAGAGAHVVVSGRYGARGGKVVADIRERGGHAGFVAADLARAEDVAALARDAERTLGRVDILVNNAGLVQFGATVEADARTFDALNVKAPFFLTAALAPRMASQGWGRIVNVTTMVAHFGMAGAALYGSSKAALHLLTTRSHFPSARSPTPPDAFSRGDAMRADTKTMSIEADPGRVFQFVADPAQLPRWAVGFARAVRQEGDRWVVTTGTGEVTVRVRADPANGVVDFVMTLAPDVEVVASSRVLARGSGVEYVFTQVQPPGMSDEAFAQSAAAVAHELTVLKALLEVDCPA